MGSACGRAANNSSCDSQIISGRESIQKDKSEAHKSSADRKVISLVSSVEVERGRSDGRQVMDDTEKAKIGANTVSKEKQRSLLLANELENDDETSHIIYRRGVGNTDAPHNDLVASESRRARSLRDLWCELDGLDPNIKLIEENLLTWFSDSVDENALLLGGDSKLALFTYDRFERDFPRETRLRLAESEKAKKLMSYLHRLTNKNSACPDFAKELLQTFNTSLRSTNVDLADEAAVIVTQLLEPMIILAEKEPKHHNHEVHSKKLKKGQKTLNNYRNIMAGKILQDPGEYSKRNEALACLQQVLKYL